MAVRNTNHEYEMCEICKKIHVRRKLAFPVWQKLGPPNIMRLRHKVGGPTFHVKSGHVTNEKIVICTSTAPMTAKLDRMKTLRKRTLPNKSYDLLTSWSCNRCKTLYFHHHNRYDCQTWEGVGIGWEDRNFQVTQLFTTKLSLDKWKITIYQNFSNNCSHHPWEGG